MRVRTRGSKSPNWVKSGTWCPLVHRSLIEITGLALPNVLAEFLRPWTMVMHWVPIREKLCFSVPKSPKWVKKVPRPLRIHWVPSQENSGFYVLYQRAQVNWMGQNGYLRGLLLKTSRGQRGGGSHPKEDLLRYISYIEQRRKTGEGGWIFSKKSSTSVMEGHLLPLLLRLVLPVFSL